MEYFLQVLANGLMSGGIYAIVAVGYTVVYGLLGFINFAHGDILALGAYLFYALYMLAGLDPASSAIGSLLLAGLAAIIVEKVAYKPLRRANRLALLISALAVSTIIQNSLGLGFGFGVLSVRRGVVFDPVRLGPIILSKVHLWTLAALLVLIGLIFLYLKYLHGGKTLRATSENVDLAEGVGINTDRIIAGTFFVSGVLAAGAGIIISMDQDLHPLMGFGFGIKAFTASVIGGIGNIMGAIYGGFMVGLLENFAAGWMPSGYKNLIVFSILIICLIFRPEGFFQKPEVKPF